MDEITRGIYTYIEQKSSRDYNGLPNILQVSNSTNESLLIRLVAGSVRFRNDSITQRTVNQTKNYSILPYVNMARSSSRTKLVSALGVDPVNQQEAINNFFNLNRRNQFIYEKLLFEMSSFFFSQQDPLAAFIHIYRSLEFISYSFPMIYASQTRDFMGSFQNLQKFFKGDETGELKFFRRFLVVLMDDEASTLSYQFNIPIVSSYPIEAIQNEFNEVMGAGLEYDFSGNTLTIAFENIHPLILTLRNRFFIC